jgi:adsorption protein B
MRQKTRWITGIALAGWDRTGWGAPLALVENWWRGRDRRTPLAMLILAVAWATVPLWLASVLVHRLHGSTAPALHPTLAAILWVNAGLLIWRLAMRAQFTAAAYGRRQGLAAIPRMLVSNVINLLAAARALARYVGMLRGTPLTWEKTAHQFPAAPA